MKNTKIKFVLCIALTAVMLFALCGCSENDSAMENPTGDTPSIAETTATVETEATVPEETSPEATTPSHPTTNKPNQNEDKPPVETKPSTPTPKPTEPDTPSPAPTEPPATEPTPTEPETPETEPNPNLCNHDFVRVGGISATCTTSGHDRMKCSKCGKTEVVPVGAYGHNWVSIEVIKEPAYMEDGLEIIQCTKCGETQERVIPMLTYPPEDYEPQPMPDPDPTTPPTTEPAPTEPTPTVPETPETNPDRDTCEHDFIVVGGEPATCTTYGYDIVECTKCGKKETVQVRAYGHDWVSIEVIQEPAYMEDGLEIIQCTKCGETKEHRIPMLTYPPEDYEPQPMPDPDSEESPAPTVEEQEPASEENPTPSPEA